MIRINLLPVKAAQKRERFIGQIVILVVVIVVTAAACAGVEYFQQDKLTKITTDISQKQREINALKQKIGEVGRFKKLQQELRGKLNVLESLKANRSGPVKFLDELNRVLPEKVWLIDFKQAGNRIVINGFGVDEERVASFMRALEESPIYGGVELKQTSKTTQKGLSVQKFSLTCSLSEQGKKK
ncbi:MAG: hypothetical protein C0616_14805 [Desulfuromonas sp.]|nr:MAG: hypothetical protein C0616_14805 [Desulfuromonas sp.]